MVAVGEIGFPVQGSEVWSVTDTEDPTGRSSARRIRGVMEGADKGLSLSAYVRSVARSARLHDSIGRLLFPPYEFPHLTVTPRTSTGTHASL